MLKMCFSNRSLFPYDGCGMSWSSSPGEQKPVTCCWLCCLGTPPARMANRRQTLRRSCRISNIARALAEWLPI